MPLVLDLALLGFPTKNFRVDQSLFTRPNPKLMEEILYFLLTLFKPASAERFCEFWPTTTPQRSKHFRAESLKFMEKWKQAGEVPRECVPRKSYLDEAVGERLEECLKNFAEFLVARKASEMKEFNPQLSPAVYACEAFLEDSHHAELVRLNARLSILVHSNCRKASGSTGRRKFEIPTLPHIKADFINSAL
ncbi:hypothetical protein PSACC_02536 [Paramicrosporidium saccamoebae]|uniref:HAUS augmin-like complex subunit 6 N-terminal domain-containing protein n=1 Tax=Paramicrosporidium saccamoebae TaxID=1246581 RepID=A0A2H9TIS7_9FUNG|nr:hypothetical protein PSACC_02536 [Paramicrosporidium saccamoebae]